ncbi:phosphotransferase [Sanguibacter suaedae]|uniref:Phosphotransferase n=1 Tax=Sanguibacter suaedae TaxID=2795737 RepID=A0A934IDY4_9MICO|nr:phosphotransferase [Sanguibacter suaedae]MBI9116091.1 phosphotransferase [Sanguibacter suaedae]
MHRSPLALAALSTIAVPGLDVHHVQGALAPDGIDSAVAVDADGRRWVVRAPRTPAAGAALEAEAAFLAGVTDHVDSGALPFVVPRAAGSAPLPGAGRAIVHPEPPGHPLDVQRLVPGPGLTASVGRAVAAVHELPVALVEASGHPVYSAEEYRQRRLSEVDEAARTGRVPATLLRRWERALEDVSLWRFRPVITHCALSSDSILVQAGQVSAVLDFFEVQVGDPADDLAWLLASMPDESADSLMEAYQLRRTELIDPHLLERAALAGELALARWLLHGVRTQRPEVVEDAVGMLRDLDRAATELGDAGATGPVPPRPGPTVADEAAAQGPDDGEPAVQEPDYEHATPRPHADEPTTSYAVVTPDAGSGDDVAPADGTTPSKED